MKEYTRNCPLCNKQIFYSNKRNKEDSEKNNRKCRSCSNKGKNNPFYGKTHTKEHIEKLKTNNPTFNEEVKKKISNSLKGKLKSNNHKLKISETIKEWHLNNENPMKGKSHSKKTREELKQISLSKWNEYRKSEDYKKWESQKSEYDLYRLKVLEITFDNELNKLKNYSKRNRYHKYELDHIYPIREGYRNKIPAELIGHIDNLRIIPRSENRSKSNKITLIPEHIQKWQNEQ